MHTHHLSAIDRSYLEAETLATPFHVAGLALVDAEPLIDRRGRVRTRAIRSHVGRRWAGIELPHLKLRPAQGDGHPSEWEEVQTLELARHVIVSGLAGRGSERDLLEHCAVLLKEPMSRDIPQWRIYIVTGLADGCIALLFQIHHSLTDGVGGSLLLSALLDGESTLATNVSEPANSEDGRSGIGFRKLASSAAKTLTQTVSNLSNIPSGIGFLARSLTTRPQSSLNVPVTSRRRLFTGQVTFAAVREVAHVLGVTVNDVILGAIAGAIGIVLEDRGDDVTNLTLEALVPVSTRSASTLIASGNHTAVLQVPLPLGIYHPIERTRAISAAMDQRKQHHVADAVAALEAIGSHLHLPREATFTKLAMERQNLVNLVVTNIMGPPQRMRFMSADVRSVFAFLPLAHDLPVSIAVCTYDGMLSIGVTVDPSVCHDGGDLTQGVIDQLSMMHRLAVRSAASSRRRADRAYSPTS